MMALLNRLLGDQYTKILWIIYGLSISIWKTGKKEYDVVRGILTTFSPKGKQKELA